MAVLGEKPFTPDEYLNLYSDLMEVFGGELDLKSLHRANILFRYQVARDGILEYGNRTEFNNYKAYAMRAYLDAGDLFKLQEKIIKKRYASLMEAVRV